MANLWSYVFWTYPIVFVCSIPLTLVLKQYNGIAAKWIFVRFLEQFAVRNLGYTWFTLLFWSNLLLYRTSAGIERKILIRFAKVYLINTVVIVFLMEWFFGSPIFERISVFSGAHCTIDSIYREYACEGAGGEWMGGFDSSSHYLFLISSSLLIWYELINHLSFPYSVSSPYNFLPSIDIERGYPNERQDVAGGTSYTRTIIIVSSSVFISLWFCSYLITSIFFHTIPEKIVGLFCGLFVPTLLPILDKI
ncbi:uncharacterized protein SPAPADRAFT_61474 [Spathaspora passalidarum NRRL Y-27907]|uniref:FIT family protein scs3 n=1 Tax=Spathaspora passalidarum (strain NRRL Y-27907 / 11-Y1) TaxID=619300 RepID=G3AMZ5_SPAPN|nr:uncharacterized protein SPAPADRAFT_61474 [Spathaspora passalidarum NRRL Y-27907]EGW32409.1 hypothetical protein SPAPADRAFT_61474 [Spathaspora passalidarum NRRL Y-27907]